VTGQVETGPASRIPVPRRKARRGLAIYFAVLIPLSAIVTTLAIAQGEAWMYAAMPIPALASIVARRALHEGFADVGWRLRDDRVRRFVALGIALPVVICAVAYGTAWITGLTTFRPDGADADATTATRLLVFAISGALMVSINTLLLVPLALGEELGWRGYMLTRLIDAGVPRPLLTSGLVWSAWHAPLVLGGVYYAGQHLAPRGHARRLERGDHQRLRRGHPRKRLGTVGWRIGHPARAHRGPRGAPLHARPANTGTERDQRALRVRGAGRPPARPGALMTRRLSASACSGGELGAARRRPVTPVEVILYA
jgi:membrane protease YdiL (CAAX protease family)